jgi:hypothetical protein
MVDGYGNDDKFRMVEDELFAIAGKFTAHLHAAEYQRLKRQAKARNADTINSISRPVVAQMTREVSAKHERIAKEKKRREGLKRAITNGRLGGLDLGSNDASPWMGTSLQGLMESPKESSIPLGRVGASSSRARPAAFSSKSSSSHFRQQESSNRSAASLLKNTRPDVMDDVTTDDSDDLDASHQQPASLSRPSVPIRIPGPPPARLSKGIEEPGSESRPPEQSDSDEDPLEALLRRRREQRTSNSHGNRGSRGADRSESARDVIPTFL